MVTDTRIEGAPPAVGNRLGDALASLVAAAKSGVVQVNGHGRRAGAAGIVWSENGRILTNHHVLQGTGGRPVVILNDGRQFAASVVAENPALDLALLSIPVEGLAALPVGDSSKLRVGSLVIAIGHPLGQREVATAGIVSGLGKVSDSSGESGSTYIRSDVMLAPGNSGGPLLNAQGEVVGINSMIFGGDLSVAVASNVAVEWLQRAGRAFYLGVQVRPVRLNRTTEDGERIVAGALVLKLDHAGPAAAAGIRSGDVLLSVAGTAVSDSAGLRKALADGMSDGRVQIALLRNGTEQRVDAHPTAR